MTAKKEAPESLELEKKDPGPAPQTDDPEGPSPLPEPFPTPEPIIQRAKLNRGNMRRISKARDELDTAMAAFVKAMDPLVFEADEDGKRIGQWPLLSAVATARESILREISELMAQQ